MDLSIVPSLLLAGALGYLLGAVPTGVLVCKALGSPDVRQRGSGHTGGLNVSRSAGVWAGVLTVAIDWVKGAAAVLAAALLFSNPWAATIAGAMAVVGHDWSVFARFGGGIGLSTLFGALFAFAPLQAVAVLAVLVLLWVVLVKLLSVRRARATILVMAAVGPLLWLMGLAWTGIALGVLGGLAVVIKTLPEWNRQDRFQASQL